MRACKLVYLHQIVQIYSYKYLKYHNLIYLSSLHLNLNNASEDYRLVKLNLKLINWKRIKILDDLEEGKIKEKYTDFINKIKHGDFTVTKDPKDVEIWYVFTDLFCYKNNPYFHSKENTSLRYQMVGSI